MIKILWPVLHILAYWGGNQISGDMTFLGMLITCDLILLWGKMFGPSIMMDKICNYIRK